jgi:hypothetical protein
MGNGSSSSGGSTLEDDLMKAQKKKEEKQRQVAFDQGGRKGSEHPEYKMRSGSGVYAEVDRNVRIARDLESQASASTTITGNKAIDMMIPGYGSLTNVSAFSKRQQASALRGGGRPVYDETGSYQGVVSKNFIGANVYSGNTDFSPIGRSQGVTYNEKTGTYTASQMQQQDSGSESTNNTPSNTQTTAINKTDSTKTLSTASRRALITGGGPDAKRRFFTA